MIQDPSSEDIAVLSITSWEDIFGRSAYASDVDGTKTELLDVIAPYRGLQPAKPCGLTNCHTPHNNGYLIVTADNRETNIGADCGKKHFPEFAAQTRKIERILKEQNLRAIVQGAQSRADATRAVIASLRTEEHGAEWVTRCLLGLRQAVVNVDPQLWHVLKRRANTGDTVVNEVRERSKKEVREMVAANLGRAEELRFESKPTGRLSGLEVLSNRLDLNANLVKGAEASLQTVVAIDARRSGGKALQTAAKSVGEIDSSLALVREAIASGRLFFTDANLALVAFIAADEAKRKKLSGLTVATLSTKRT